MSNQPSLLLVLALALPAAVGCEPVEEICHSLDDQSNASVCAAEKCVESTTYVEAPQNDVPLWVSRSDGSEQVRVRLKADLDSDAVEPTATLFFDPSISTDDSEGALQAALQSAYISAPMQTDPLSGFRVWVTGEPNIEDVELEKTGDLVTIRGHYVANQIGTMSPASTECGFNTPWGHCACTYPGEATEVTFDITFPLPPCSASNNCP